MDNLNLEKVSKIFTPGVTLTEPIIGRKYTLSYSTITGEFFIRISLAYLSEKIEEGELQILGGWGTYQGQFAFFAFITLGNEDEPEIIAARDKIYRSVLPTALEAIAYVDRIFFSTHIELNYVPIIVYFSSVLKEYNKVENWGTFSMYGPPVGEEEY